VITYKTPQGPKLLDKLLVWIYHYKNRYLRKIIRVFLLHRPGAELYSGTLREIFSKYHGVNVGMYSYGAFHKIPPPGTVIGRYSTMPRNLLVLDGSHPIKHRSSHPFFFNPDFGFIDKLLIQRRTKLIIGNDVYIGMDVTILPAVKNIGDGAVIAAGSVVVKDVPPFAIVGGNPAKLIRYRFSQQIIDQITKSAWWEKDIEEIKKDEKEFASFLHPME